MKKDKIFQIVIDEEKIRNSNECSISEIYSVFRRICDREDIVDISSDDNELLFKTVDDEYGKKTNKVMEDILTYPLESNVRKYIKYFIKQGEITLTLDLSLESRAKEIARLREKAMHDEASFLADARNEGIEIGEKKGRAEEREKMIAAMRANNISEEQIQAMLKSME